MAPNLTEELRAPTLPSFAPPQDEMMPEDIDFELSCEEMYGPYPKGVPVPFLSKDGETPPTEEVEAAKSYIDLGTKYPDYRDKGTPDEWIPRDGRLVRLTGRHPFNVEPPMSELRKTRFITPTSLHYVRNHGACPKLTWENHTLVVGGVVPRPMELTMDQLVNIAPHRELPVTLVCAGNRRKEQNLIRQTIGFNWGPCGVSTNVWKGCLLRDLLLAAGVNQRKTRGYHVEFIGVEDLPNKVGPGPFKEAPWGKLVKYGTSVPLARALNPAYDIIVAWEANGERLLPDHGFPLRIIIPGYIGGRMVKWLKEINVIPHETKNHYHYHDNRILPPQITAEESLKSGWFYKPDYIFKELNVNSAIASPLHDEELSFTENIDSTYNINGYAYTGGGRKVTRVEISFDFGVHWEVTKLDRTEQPTDHGMYWCWLWWDYNVKIKELVGCEEIWCRAWDESNTCQPENPTWNLMGMGNNQIFRLKVHFTKNAAGEHIFKFEQPTQPGQLSGGWMTKAEEKPISAGFGKLEDIQDDIEVILDDEDDNSSTNKGPKRVYTMQEISKHNTEDDCWIIVKNKVYDCTKYLEHHPGGVDSITLNAGDADATEDFVAIHSEKATKMLQKYYIGDLDLGRRQLPRQVSQKLPQYRILIGRLQRRLQNLRIGRDIEDSDENVLIDANGRKVALNARKKISVTLQEKKVLSQDSFLLDFALPSKDHVLGLPTGKHMFFYANVNGETVVRRYTPISSNHEIGRVKFVIKAYRPNEKFPKGGKMSQHLDSMKVGDKLDVRGPVGEFEYLGDGRFLLHGKVQECNATRFNMIAGGTGITPCLQIASEVLRHKDDPTQITLIYANRNEEDILMRSQIDKWATGYPNRFKVHYVLSGTAPDNWKYSTGHVNKQMFDEHLFQPSCCAYSLLCGPDAMLQKGCIPNLKAMGFKDDFIY